jgi:hypothetical protein
MKKNKWILLGTVLLILIAVSCKKDDTSNSLKAVFSYIADGYKVNFTNFSTNATDYIWDFGDQSTGSILSNPLHVFSKKGQYLVTLTASNQSETSTFIDTVLIIGPNIKIDGDFTDWAYVEYTHENAVDAGGTLLAVKTFASAGYLNFYLEGTSDLTLAVIDIYLDSDNDPETGLKSWMYPAGSGADFLCEGSVSEEWGDVYSHAGPGNDWSWDSFSTFGDMIKFSEIKNNNERKAIEFSIKRTGLGTLNKFVNFAIVESDGGWTEIGAIPIDQTDSSKFAQIAL